MYTLTSIDKFSGVSEFRPLLLAKHGGNGFFPYMSYFTCCARNFQILSNLSSHGPGMLGIMFILIFLGISDQGEKVHEVDPM